MALKKKLDKVAFEALSDVLKAEYKASDAGEYVLDVDDADVTALLNAKNHEKEQRKAAQAKIAELEANLEKEKLGKAKTSGDIEAVEASWQAKLDTTKNELTASIQKREAQLQGILSKNVAHQVATELFGDKASILEHHILGRISADLEGDTPKTRILDAMGKPSASTLDELKAEFKARPEFAPFISISKASGSGAPEGKRTPVAPNSNTNQKRKSDMTPKELAEVIAANKKGTSNGT